MNTLIGTFCILFMSISSAAEPSEQGAKAAGSTASETMSQLSRSADQQLAGSIAELNTLREQISAEKLPLAQELTTLEEKLVQLRRENDRVTRLVDEGTLGIAAIKAEMKARQDELSYIGNLLDEYARSFESKINVSEMQYLGEGIEAAKQATENKELSMAEKFARQVAFANVSLKRLFDAVGGMRFPGVGVDLNGVVADGQFAIIGPVALFRANSGGAAGLVVPQSGSTKPLIRPLEGPMQAGLVALVESGEGTMPLDPTRGGALKALVQRTNLFAIFRKGGPVMWPLLAASILALGTVVERLFFLLGQKVKRDPKALEKLLAQVGQGDTDGAIRTGKASKFYVVRALGYALAHKETALPSALMYAQAQELKRFRRGLPILDTVITLAPLLGLLGTVTGMMGSFSLIGGELSSPGAITGGIAEALIATAFGLGIAITALLPFNFLNARAEEARHEIESAATQLELLMGPAASRSRSPQAVPGSPGAPGIAAPAAPDTPHSSRGAQEARERPEVAVSTDDLLRRHRELQRQRLAIQRQIADLQLELDDQELAMANVTAREQPGKD